jgi:hypothetical protein
VNNLKELGTRKYLGPYVKYSDDVMDSSIGRKDLYCSIFLIWSADDRGVSWRCVNLLGEPGPRSHASSKLAMEDLDRKLISLGYVLIDDEAKWESLKVLV